METTTSTSLHRVRTLASRSSLVDLLTSGDLEALEHATFLFHTSAVRGGPGVSLDRSQCKDLQRMLLSAVGTEYDSALAAGALCDSIKNAVLGGLLTLELPLEELFEPIAVQLLQAPCGHLLVDGLPRMPELQFEGVSGDVRGIIGLAGEAKQLEYSFGAEIRVNGQPLSLAEVPALQTELNEWSAYHPAARPGCQALLRALDDLYRSH